ncbi:hypothetical protein [Geomonas oryzae]|uniref:hypothetical protein n=1 Tax=Geomonas oryzae TaxID=2364273 RepID=UPI00100A4B2B|nr:hypothetical protein [Geomonas oryzae]
MRPSSFLLLGFLFLSGCETLNEAMVRHMMKEPGLSGEVLDQIRDGLQRRERVAPEKRESVPASPFLDQG